MIGPIVNSERAVAKIFNSAIAAAAIGAAWEVGLLDAITSQEAVHVHNFAVKHDLDGDSVEGLVSALAVVEVVERDRDAGTVTAGQLLDEAYKMKSLFHWLALGSGGLFSRLQYALPNKNRTGTYYSRDPKAISYACAEANSQFFDPVFLPAVDALKYKFHAVADLGSGSGERLMQLMERHPGTTGIGIDIARPAVKDAAAEATRRGLGSRLSFTEGDVRTIAPRPEFAHVDLLTSFLMGHDFWPRENCVAILRKLREAFPSVRRFFLGDTTRVLLNTNPGKSKYAITEEDVPIFTLGFEVAHAVMGDYVPTMDEWEGVFAEGGWRCVQKHLIQPPSLSVIFELEKA